MRKGRLGKTLTAIGMSVAIALSCVTLVPSAENMSVSNAWDGRTVAQEYDGGKGTQEEPYQIATGGAAGAAGGYGF